MTKNEPLKTVIVTGASRGIGAAIARLAGARGYAVAVNFSASEACAGAVVHDIVSAGGRAVAVRADVTSESDVIRLFETAERELGPIRGLVNNAGVTAGFARVEAVTLEALQRVFAVNVIGTILCAREAVRRMSTRSGAAGGAGEWVHYAASKGAVESFTIGLAREVAAEGIRVNAVAPGIIDTELHAAAGEPNRLERLRTSIPMQRVGSPEEVAEGVLWLLSPAVSYTTGAILTIGGGRG